MRDSDTVVRDPAEERQHSDRRRAREAGARGEFEVRIGVGGEAGRSAELRGAAQYPDGGAAGERQYSGVQLDGRDEARGSAEHHSGVRGDAGEDGGVGVAGLEESGAGDDGAVPGSARDSGEARGFGEVANAPTDRKARPKGRAAARIGRPTRLRYIKDMKHFGIALLLALSCVAAGPETEKAKTMGNINAPIRLDLYSDFTCPHCKHFHDELLPKLADDFITPGKAYLVFHEYVLTGQGHEYSREAALYADAAAHMGKYAQVAGALFASQASWAVTGKVWDAVSPVLTAAERT